MSKWHLAGFENPALNKPVLVCWITVKGDMDIAIGYYGSDGFWHYNSNHEPDQEAYVFGWKNLPDTRDLKEMYIRNSYSGIGITT